MLNMMLGVTCVSLSVPLGIALALGRQSSMPLIKWICVVFIEFVRGVPLITLLFVASTTGSPCHAFHSGMPSLSNNYMAFPLAIRSHSVRCRGTSSQASDTSKPAGWSCLPWWT